MTGEVATLDRMDCTGMKPEGCFRVTISSTPTIRKEEEP